MPIFDGLAVVELSDGMSGALAGMVLADNGADVLKVDDGDGRDGTWASPAAPMWHRSKTRVGMDLSSAEGRAELLDLVSRADVVIDQLGIDRSGSLDLQGDEIRRANPGLVSCRIAGFGIPELDARYRASDPIVAARSGRFSGQDALAGALFTGRPVFNVAPICSYGAAMLAVEGVTAALIEGLRSGLGQDVETSLLDGATAATMRLAFGRDGDRIRPRDEDSALVLRGIMLTFTTAECRDGRYIQMCARQDHHFRNWFRAMGIEHLLEERRFAGLPLGLRSYEDAEEIESIVRRQMATRTQAEWMAAFTDEFDVGADPLLTADEFLAHPQMVQNGWVTTVDDPDLGPVRGVGPLAHFERTPSRTGRAASPTGPTSPQPMTGLGPAPDSRRPSAGAPSTEGPLAGTTVLELAYFVAAPLGTALLAELGARVIKVEPPDGDPLRRAGLEFAQMGHGKESVVLDLKSDAGLAAMRDLLRDADLFLTNLRPGVPDRLGLGYDDVRAINPRLVYLHAGSYGRKGPERHRAAFHSTPHALCGGGIAQAGEGNAPVDDSYPDPAAGLAVAAAAAMALYAQARTGLGQYVETSMLCASGYVHIERCTRCHGVEDLPINDHEQRGTSALTRLYRCSDGWVQLDCPADAWPDLVGALGLDAQLATDHAITAAIDKALDDRRASEVEEQLLAAGVPVAVVAESFESFVAGVGRAVPASHPTFGDYFRLAPRLRFSRSTASLRPTSALGEFTHAVLAEIGRA